MDSVSSERTARTKGLTYSGMPWRLRMRNHMSVKTIETSTMTADVSDRAVT